MSIRTLARPVLKVAAATLVLLILAAVLVWNFWRPGMAQFRAHLAPTASADAGLTVSWFGVSAVVVRAGDSAIFIDPFFSRPGGLARLLTNPAVVPDEARIRRWLDEVGINRLDAVLVSHSHYDHGMDAGIVARLTGADLIGSSSTLNIGRGAGLPADRLILAADQQTLMVGDFQIRFVASRHAGATGGRPLGDIEAALVPPARVYDYRQGGTYSILISHPEGRILHHGSAGFVPGALAEYEVDTVLLGVALIEDLPRYLEETVLATSARQVFPVHWDDFTRPLNEPLSPLPIVVRLDRLFREFPSLSDAKLQTLPLATPVAVIPGR